MITLAAISDQRKAERIRFEYGQVGWLVSWHYQPQTGRWLARLSSPAYEQTVERTGHSRCDAIDQATRTILALMHQEWLEMEGAVK